MTNDDSTPNNFTPNNSTQPIISDQIQLLIDLWKKDLKYGYPTELYNEYGGTDMNVFFGPIEERKHIQYYASHPNEYEKILKVIRSYSNPAKHIHHGKIILPKSTKISMLELVIKVFDAFSNIINPATKTGVFKGLQLNSFNIDEAVMGGFLLDYRNVMINMEAQRETDLVRIFTLAVNFDSSLVYGAKGRFSKLENKVYCNDGSHGTIALALHGVLTIPVAFSLKEHRSIDFNQFLACNFHVLLVTEYDVWKNQVARMKANFDDNLPAKADDTAAYNLYLALTDAKVSLVPKGQTPVAGECNVTAQIQRLFKTYCNNQYQANSVFITALKIVRKAWISHPVDFAVVWGLIEFLESQSKRVQNDPKTFSSLVHLLPQQWNKPKDVWTSVARQIKTQYPVKQKSKYTGWKDHRFTSSGSRGLMIAAAIKTLIDNRDSWIRSQPGKNVGYDLNIEPIIHEGRIFEIDMPYTTANVKAYTIFVPTVGEFDDGDVYIPTPDNNIFESMISEFESRFDNE